MKDEELLQVLYEKPKDGIRILAEKYGGLIYALTWRRLSGSLSREDVEECVSDIFFECYQCREQIDLDKGTIKSFLLIIAERRTIKYYERKGAKFDTVPLDDETGLELPSYEDIEKEYIKREESSRLFQKIKSLGEPNSSIIISKYYYGMTAKEIGKRFGMSKNAVEKRVKRSLQKLKDILEET